MSKRYVVVLVKNPENPKEFLMGKRADNYKINFPGGGINPNEKSKDGAARELLEETGLKATSLKLLGCNLKKDKEGKFILVYSYLATVDGKASLNKDPDEEFSSLFWVDPKSIPENELHIPTKENTGLMFLSKA